MQQESPLNKNSEEFNQYQMDDQNAPLTTFNFNDEKDDLAVRVKNGNEIVFIPSRQIINYKSLTPASILISAAFIMGLCINSFGHIEIIKNVLITPNANGDSSRFTKEYLDKIETLGGLFPIGGMIAAPISSAICDRFGKKYPTMVFYVVSILGFFFKFIAYYAPYEIIFIGRFFDGIASGGLMVTAISWLFDLLPQKSHFFFKPLIQIFINLGILFASLFSLFNIIGEKWHLMFLLQFAMSLLSLCVCILLPESHVYEYSKYRDRSKLEISLKNLRQKGYDRAEVEELIQSVEKNLSIKQMSIIQFLTLREFYAPLIATIFMNIFQQAGGINAIAAFSVKLILQKDSNQAAATAVSSTTDSSTTVSSTTVSAVATPTSFEALNQSLIYSLYIYLVGVIASIIASPTVSKFPRKIMLIIGFGGMTLCFIIILILQNFKNLPSYAIVILYAVIFCIFQFGPGPLVWFICIEIFPPDAVSSAQGVSTVANWFANSCVYFLFPIFLRIIDKNVLYIFAVINFVAVLFTSFGVVETLNKKPETIINEYNRKYKFL